MDWGCPSFRQTHILMVVIQVVSISNQRKNVRHGGSMWILLLYQHDNKERGHVRRDTSIHPAHTDCPGCRWLGSRWFWQRPSEVLPGNPCSKFNITDACFFSLNSPQIVHNTLITNTLFISVCMCI